MATTSKRTSTPRHARRRQPRRGEAPQPLLLDRTDGGGGRPEGVDRRAFTSHDDDEPTAPHDQIDLPGAAAPVAGHDRVAVALVPGRGDVLAPAAAVDVRMWSSWSGTRAPPSRRWTCGAPGGARVGSDDAAARRTRRSRATSGYTLGVTVDRSTAEGRPGSRRDPEPARRRAHVRLGRGHRLPRASPCCSSSARRSCSSSPPTSCSTSSTTSGPTPSSRCSTRCCSCSSSSSCSARADDAVASASWSPSRSCSSASSPRSRRSSCVGQGAEQPSDAAPRRSATR